MGAAQEFGRGLRGLIRLAGMPVRRARDRGGIALQAYRGYGSTESAFVIGRVFRQGSATPAQGPTDIRRQLRDMRRRLLRRPVRGARVRGLLLGAEVTAVTDRDGYFRLHWRLDAPPPPSPWVEATLTLDGPQPLTARAEVYIAPPTARFAVISDIDDTVMRTGVANKLVTAWRLFVEDAEDRTAFPGVSALYRALHGGACGSEGNPMLYVSRAPWGLYEVLDEFFRRHDIPGGPILLLREWGVSWRRPLPRRAEDHKHVLIQAILETYRHLPVVLIGDSGQHDPEIYRDIAARHAGRVLAIYIRDVSGPASRARDRATLGATVAAAGSELIVAADTLAMAEHAARIGLIAPDTLAEVRRRQPEPDPEPDPAEADPPST